MGKCDKKMFTNVETSSRALHRAEVRCLLCLSYSVTDALLCRLPLRPGKPAHTHVHRCMKGYESA